MKKNIKGFTLVELLAVITVLGIIMTIGAISVTDLINRSKEKSYNEQINAIELAAKKFATKHTEILDEESTTNYILIEELKKDGLLENIDIIDPRSGKEIEGCINVIYNKDNNKYEYNFTDKCKYTEKLLNGADPKLSKELIPVIISDNGTVTKADVTEKWYSYEEKIWANAVILMDDTKKYNNGDTIPESNIKEYYVWIPRYSYKLWNVDGTSTENAKKPITLKFGSEAKTTGTNNGDMYLHPAFSNFNTNGIWVGKFEISYNEETYTNSVNFLNKTPNYQKAIDSKQIIIKPNVKSLSMKSVSEFFTLIKSSHSKLNSHMITNMEWGAITYLAYSIYGRCDSTTCTKITINNICTASFTSTTITGCAGDSVSASALYSKSACVNPYNTAKGYLASTTGNISGIYDISGGSWEYVMGVLENGNGTIYTGVNSSSNSGFKGLYGASSGGQNTTGLELPRSNYYDTYLNKHGLGTDKYTDNSSGKLGDATIEFGTNWYDTTIDFATSTYPWFIRGGAYYNPQYVGRRNGAAYIQDSTRVVLAF